MKPFIRFTLLLVVPLLLITSAALVMAQSPVELNVWLLTDTPQTYEQLIADFNAANPDIVASYTGHATDAHKDVLRQVINTEAAPDVFFTWGGAGLFGFYIDTGGVEPLDEIWAANNWDDRFSAAEKANAMWDGKIYGMPFRIRTMGLFYRVDLFEKAGITAEPTTYEELVEVNNQLKAAGLIPLAMGGKFSWMPMRLLDSIMELKCGPEKHDDLKYLRVNWTEEPCATETFVEFHRWVEEGWLPKDFLGIDPEAGAHLAVNSGAAAMYYEGDWVIPRFAEEGMKPEQFGFFYFPTNTNRASFFGEMLLISSTSQHKEEAARFLDWMSSEETQTKYAGQFGGLAPTVNVPMPADSVDLIKEVNGLLAERDGIYLPADQSLPLQVVTEGYWKAQDQIIAGTLNPEDAPAVVQEAIDKYLEANPQ